MGALHPGATGFVASGIVLDPGDTAILTAVDGNPQVYVFSAPGGPHYGPNGQPGSTTCINPTSPCPAPNVASYALIAKVGSGPWVFVGTGPTTVSGVGEIFFALNDGKYFDNVGGFVVTSATLSPPTNADQCKKGGWMLRVDRFGNAFKNQGDCVSYVATGGRNPAAG